MLPPLKSLILKWGASCSMALLSQVSTSYPRVPRDSFARTRACFLIIQLSGYGQFMLSTSFLPLHGCWSLHYDLCPSYFHTHSDRYAFSRWSWTYHQASDCTENDNSQMFCQEVLLYYVKFTIQLLLILINKSLFNMSSNCTSKQSLRIVLFPICVSIYPS